ncbi:ATP-binding cassette domain-containing protein [Tenuibacillus multivorans]|uniref:ABC-2 type transport system ATP-binding protein n=1 Tax=Tenuibacillus multivorans TaxID=237069 RepID=A0A1G9X0H4_9BACI|nr:ABC transporter ATP-binding protein [Tenuibacillus multivorans]GEL77289.1 ABC transporter [Tenuibacillus multivorans]SDM89845.1 ABC-2 type transport system ATP-binding protein [Tenuibacillus multivorans]
MTYNIKAQNVSVFYKDFKALDDISVSLEGNKIIGMIGRNGAGKTTFLSLLAAFRDVSRGVLEANQEKIFENPKVMQDVFLVYDSNNKDLDYTVQSMLDHVKKFRPYYDEEYAMHLVERFKLPLKKSVKKLSKGMQSAVNAAIGLASRAPVTIFDEVYLGMDAPTRSIFYKELLEDQTNHPRMIILSTHLVSEMDHLFDEIVIIDQGELLLHEDYDTLINRGVEITGAAESVDHFVNGKEILNEEKLGGTKAVMVYETLTEQEQAEARQQGLDLQPISLQDLFIHLTGGES